MSYAFTKAAGSTSKVARRTLTTLTNMSNDYGYVESAGATFTSQCKRGDILFIGGYAEVRTVTFIAASGITGGDWFQIYSAADATLYVIWYRKSGVGTSPGIGGATHIMVDILNADTAANVATKTTTTLNANAGFAADFTISGTGTSRTITNDAVGACTDASDGAAPTGFTITTTVQGATAGANAGLYIINRVISDTELEVRTQFASPGASSEQMQVYNNASTLVITDEATTSWTAIKAANGEFVDSHAAIGNTGVTAFGFTRFAVFLKTITVTATSAITTTWESEKEIVIAEISDECDIVSAEASSGDLVINIGEAGSDLLGGRQTSVWCNFDNSGQLTASNFTINLRASVWLGPANLQFTTGLDPNVSSSLIRSGGLYLNPHTNPGGNYDAVIFVGETFPFVAEASATFADNLFFCNADNTSVLLAAVGVVLSGLKFSDDVFSPYISGLVSAIIVLDPKEDYAMTTLFQVFSIDTLYDPNYGYFKAYTYNPQFVYKKPDLQIGDPINGLQVRIFEIDEARLVKVIGSTNGLYRITINGVNCDFTASGHTQAQIASNLNSAINASAAPVSSLVTTFDGDGETIQITPDDPNAVLTVTVSAPNNNLDLLDNEREIANSPFTTDANGRINSGAGEQLMRGAMGAFGLRTERKHRIVTAGPYTRQVNAVLSITSPVSTQFPVDLIQPDYEGEFST